MPLPSTTQLSLVFCPDVTTRGMALTDGVPIITHAWVLHACEIEPEHGWPPFAGAGLVQVRDCVPPPQESEHADQDDQPPFMGTTHAWVLHDCELDPEHDRPPFAGVGLVQVRDCVPPPQDAEQDDHDDQPPSTGGGSAQLESG